LGFLEKNIYKNNSHTLKDLKQNVHLRILKIAEESLQGASFTHERVANRALLIMVDICNTIVSYVNTPSSKNSVDSKS
jgi:hypothetical protein